MSELSKLLGNAGAPHTIVHDGKTYPFRLIDAKARDAFAKWCYQQAREAVYADREHLSSDEYLTALERMRDRYEAGQYVFTGERAQSVLRSSAGTLALLRILSGATDDDIMALLLARPEEIKSLLSVIMKESFPAADRGAPNG